VERRGFRGRFALALIVHKGKNVRTLGGPSMRMMHATFAATLFVSTFAAAGCGAPESADDPTSEIESLTCPGAIPLEVIVKGRENRFGLRGQQVALNPGIPIERICNNSVAKSCKSTCLAAKAQAEATGVRGFQDPDPVRLRQMGVLADNFNAALGLTTNFRALGADSIVNDGGVAQCNAKQLQVVVKGKEHRFGFDGRQVALNAAIPIQNICQQVSQSCQSVCAAAAAAAAATGIKGFSGDDNAEQLRQMGVLADDFNAALGSTSNFQNAPIFLN
jgi:hypothetical protein